jgi:hypothetical protein
MFWLWWLWMALTAGVMVTSHITMVRGDKRLPRALLEAIVANLIEQPSLSGPGRMLVESRW